MFQTASTMYLERRGAESMRAALHAAARREPLVFVDDRPRARRRRLRAGGRAVPGRRSEARGGIRLPRRVAGLGPMITSRDNERLKLVRKLHEKRWRDKLGLFFVEGEDAVAAASAEPVDLLLAGEDVEPELLAEVASAPHPPRTVGVYRRVDLPAWEEREATLALWRLADPGNVGTLIRTAEAFGAAVALSDGCADPTSAEGAPRKCRLDLARPARRVGGK